jgi:hypothetical protein
MNNKVLCNNPWGQSYEIKQRTNRILNLEIKQRETERKVERKRKRKGKRKRLCSHFFKLDHFINISNICWIAMKRCSLQKEYVNLGQNTL